MNNLGRQLYLIAATLLTTLNVCCAANDSREPLLQRAIATPQSRIRRSTNITTPDNADLNSFTRRPRPNLNQIHNDILSLEDTKRSLEEDRRIINSDIIHIKSRLHNLCNQAYALRYRPDRKDFEDQDNNQPWDKVMILAIKSIIQDNWICLKKDTFVSKKVQYRKDSIREGFLALGCLFTVMPFIVSMQQKDIERVRTENQHDLKRSAERKQELQAQLRQRNSDCSSDLDFAIQECVHPSLSDYINKRPFENDMTKEGEKKFQPTSRNPYFTYAIVPYQKPEYFQWKAGIYRKSQQKTK